MLEFSTILAIKYSDLFHEDAFQQNGHKFCATLFVVTEKERRIYQNIYHLVINLVCKIISLERPGGCE